MDPEKLRTERELQRHTQLSLATAAKVSERTIARLENGESASTDVQSRIATVLGKPLTFFMPTVSPPTEAECLQMVRTLRTAGYDALMAARRAVYGYAKPARVVQNPRKITDKDVAADPTEVVDQVTGDAIRHALARAASVKGHPLASGYVFVEEECGVMDIPGPGDVAPRWVIVVDPADDSAAMSLGLAGTVLLSAYLKGYGWVAAVACDFVRMRLFSRVTGKAAHALQLKFSSSDTLPFPGDMPPPADEDPSGAIVDIGSSGRKSVRGATVCIYLGKADRIQSAAAGGATLLAKANFKSIHSYGGSRGPLLVAEGSLDAAIEYTKGFKRLDLIPGIFIAEGAGCTVLLPGRNGRLQADFGRDELMEALFETSIGREKLIEEGRQRFIVAASSALADQIANQLNW